MTPELYKQAQRAVQVITHDEQHYSAGRAILFILEEVGWHTALVRWARRRPFIWAIELGYRIVARNRPLFERFMFRSIELSELEE